MKIYEIEKIYLLFQPNQGITIEKFTDYINEKEFNSLTEIVAK